MATDNSINGNVTDPMIPYTKLQKIMPNIIIYFLTVECIIIFPIIVGNILILTSIVRFRKLRGRMHVLIGNLAVSDLLVGVIVIPMDVYIVSLQRLNIPKLLCLFRGSIMDVLTMASVLNLFVISLERYVAIVHPMRHKTCLTRSRLLFISVGCWVLSIIVGFLPVMGWNNWHEDAFCLDELVLPSEYKGLVSLILMSSLFANFFMYITVSRIALDQVERSRTEMMNINGRTNDNDNAFHRFQQVRSLQNIRKTKLMIFVLGIFALCWGPYCVGILLTAFIFGSSVKAIIVVNVLASIGTINSGLNWIVFGLKNPEFRKAFFIICRRKRSVDSSIDLGTASTDI